MKEFYPQLTFLALMFLELGFGISHHGRIKKGKHSFWNTLFSFSIIMAILHWGSFFDGILR